MAASVTRWLYLVVAITFCLIVFGGFVRLTRAGLSIVEWNPVSGVLPPIGEVAWQAEFAKYQQSPEFRLVNHEMTIDGYRRIFYIEWAHRLIARLAGLAVVLPLGWFLWRGVVPWRKAGAFVGLALLFGVQGGLGWLMVRSGLFDTPAVSHYRLTVHLLTALLLLGCAFWMAMSRGLPETTTLERPGRTAPSRWALATMVLVVVQIAWGGLVAGLKAGHVSYTWPLMGGTLMPTGLFGSAGSWWVSAAASPAAVHWIHRWLAFAVAAAVVGLVRAVRHTAVSAEARRTVYLAAGFVLVQIALGVSVLLFHVPTPLALVHQATGIAVFVAMLAANHRLLRCEKA